MRRLLILFSLFSFVFSVDYQSEIQPIWDSHCGGCHLSGSSGGLNLLTYDNLMSSGSVVPGNALQSSLYDRITRPESAAGDMPPAGSLSQAQIDLVEQWINEGALEQESTSVSGCMDSNAITCDDDINTLYFPECDTCSDDSPCENYYNPEATEDNGLCMYNDVPSEDEFLITHPNNDGVFVMDWSAFTPPVDIDQYVLQRCVDTNGDSDGDGELEYESCAMVIDQFAGFLGTSFSDDYENWEDGHSMKYTFNVDYPNNNYWGSAQGIYYYEDSEPEVLLGDVNSDGIINVIDIVNLVNYILSGANNIDIIAADFNEDSIINVIDIVNLVNFILS